MHNNKSIDSVFSALNAKIKPLPELTDFELKKYDVALCCDAGASHLRLRNIYIFTYEIAFLVYGAPLGDFLFTFRKGREAKYHKMAAQMVVGNPKNDSIINNSAIKEQKRILYIDSGHIPFGREGKIEIADMLLLICKENPDYEVVIKPRWLPNFQGAIAHRNATHIYDIVYERCNGDLPKNLTMLNEHLNLHELIQSSHSVICLQTGAIFDVLSHGKGLCIAINYKTDYKFDMTQSERQMEIDYFNRTNCAVPIGEIHRYMPHGIRSGSTFLHEELPQITGASSRIADVMEYVFANYISLGKFPDIMDYCYENYERQMRPANLSWDDIKRLRFKNSAYQELAVAIQNIDSSLKFPKSYEFVDNHWADYEFSNNGFADFIYEFKLRLNFEVRDAAPILSADDIKQSYLLEALFNLGYDNDILAMPQEQILCKGPWHYYVARILQERNEIEACIPHFIRFLKNANHRAYEKYQAELLGGGYKLAYSEIFRMYDGKNIPIAEIETLLNALYEKKFENYINWKLRNKAWNLLGKAVSDGKDSVHNKNIYWLLRHKNTEFRNITIERNEAKIQALRYQHRWFRIPYLLKRGVQCVQDHGFRYTTILGCKKMKKFLKDRINKLLNISLLRITVKFGTDVLRGFKIYARTMRKYGSTAVICLTSTGTGDAYFLALRFYQFCKTRPSTEVPVYGVFEKSGLEIAELFDIPYPEAFTYKEFNSLFALQMFGTNCALMLCLLHCHTFRLHVRILSRLYGFRSIDFVTLNNIHAYGKDIALNTPRLEPVFDSRGVESLFEENSLIPGKTVYISPYAKSMKPLPLRFWSRLVAQLNQSGFTVCTNCVSVGAAIKGTIPLFVPHTQSVPFIEMAGVVIALRSGFCDVTESSRSLKIALYNEQERAFNFGVATTTDVYNMQQCYARENQYDLIYTPRHEISLIDKIVKLAVEYINLKETNSENHSLAASKTQ
jgi:hypothetical protein